MGNFGYIGAAPTQSAGANKGILSNADIIDLKNKTPEQISGDFINLDFFACAGGGGGGGGSYQHGYGATYAGGGGGGTPECVSGGNGGSGIVIIRYRFQ